MTDPAIKAFEEELTRLLGAPIAVSSPPEVVALWEGPGVEVALARDAARASRLRPAWRERQGGRGRPLLLVAPAIGADAGKRVAVVGPTEVEPRLSEPHALAAQIAIVAQQTPQRASRALEDWLSHVSSEAIPGVVVRQLLTNHYVRTRLPWHRAEDLAQLRAAAESARGQTEWRQTLGALGYQVRQRAGTGCDLLDGERALALVYPLPDPSQFGRCRTPALARRPLHMDGDERCTRDTALALARDDSMRTTTLSQRADFGSLPIRRFPS